MTSILLLLLSVLFIIMLTVRWNVHPFLALLGAALFFALFSGMNLETLVDSVNSGFGNTLGKIGIVIVLGVIIGAFLEHSGGAFKLAEWILKLIGRKRVHETMGLVGFVDAGGAFETSVPQPGEDLFYAAGGGLRYYSPMGPLRMDLGFPLNGRNGVDDPYQLYISIGQAF